MLSLTLAALLLADVPTSPSGRVRRLHDVAALTHRDAMRLDGRRVLVRVTATSLPWGDLSDDVGFDAATDDAGVLGSVCFAHGAGRDLDLSGPLVGEGRFRLVWFPPSTIDGHQLPWFWEYRVEEARLVRQV